MNTIERILTPLDFSPCSNAALEYAIFLAERFDATLQILYVSDPARAAVPDPFLWHGEATALLSDFARNEAGREIDRILARLERRGMRARGRIEAGDPYARIVAVASDEKFDLIVMGTHGRTGLAHLIAGSVAEKVVRHAPCPVTTIRLPDAVAPTAREVAP